MNFTFFYNLTQEQLHKQNKTKQNKKKQSKTKQNKTKQNKTKQTNKNQKTSQKQTNKKALLRRLSESLRRMFGAICTFNLVTRLELP